MRRNYRSPMVIFTPKSLLRAPKAVSQPGDFAEGGFDNVIDDVEATAQPAKVKRLLFCSGKVYYDLMAAREARYGPEGQEGQVAIVRIEQLYPWDLQAITAILERYAKAEHVMWVQEEPANMGAWSFVRYRLQYLLGTRRQVTYAGRKPSAAPAGGSMRLHRKRQQRLLDIAMGDLVE